ncbi:ubiquitin fusion degradation protein 1 [Pancytospora philotis]|nr:ubiquitin fusion degradation protein 1 [Pancytospora philotis]
MFSSLINAFMGNKKWYFKPAKYAKDSPNHFSSKLLLPHSVLRDLTMLNYQPPYLFEISNESGILRTACSVLDFASEGDEVQMPAWMYDQLEMQDSETAALAYIKVERAEGINLQPHSVDFLDVENPRAELEKGLLDYHVLSYGDDILLNFEDVGRIRFTVTQIFPEHLDSLYTVDTDLNVDFDEPIGYREKLEDEKTVKKYLEIGNENREIKSLRMKRVGLFLDWDNLVQ